MKKIIVTIFLLSFSLTPTYANDEVQLTDYRYMTKINGMGGYVFCNPLGINDVYYVEAVSDEETHGNDKVIRVYDSVVLAPDGTEIIEQGKYTIEAQNGNNVLRYPIGGGYILARSIENDLPKPFKDRMDKLMTIGYTFRHIFDRTNYILDMDGNELARFESDFETQTWNPLYSGHYCGIVNGDLAVIGTFGFINSPVHMFGLLRISDMKMIFINKHGGANDYSGSKFYISEDKKSFMLKGDDVSGEGHFTIIDYEEYYTFDGERIEKPENTEYTPYIYKPDGIKTNGNGFYYYDTDKRYTAKGVDIGGRTYYAIFRELEDGETAKDFEPKQKPSAWAENSINAATSEGLLYNNANCRYNAPITRQDFCILAVEAFCKANNTDAGEYIKQNNIALDFDRFDDTENPYILLAEKLGIAKGMSETEFAPNEYITRQQAAVMLSNLAKLSGLEENSPRVDFIDTSYFADWARAAIFNISAIKNAEGTAIMAGTEPNKFSPWMYYTREQAYVTIYRLYKICNN